MRVGVLASGEGTPAARARSSASANLGRLNGLSR